MNCLAQRFTASIVPQNRKSQRWSNKLLLDIPASLRTQIRFGSLVQTIRSVIFHGLLTLAQRAC